MKKEILLENKPNNKTLKGDMTYFFPKNGRYYVTINGITVNQVYFRGENISFNNDDIVIIWTEEK